MKILILAGGTSTEREVSLWSAQNVYQSLQGSEFTAELLDISSVKPIELCNKVLNGGFDLVFPIFHGKPGEDGVIQGFLETIGVKYIGSSVLSCAVTIDKLRTKLIFKALGFPQAQFISLRANSRTEESVYSFIEAIGLPVVVKPNSQGSSVGVSIVRKKEDLSMAINEAFKYDKIVLVEEFIKGKEITCAVIGNDKPTALPLVEIVPKTKFFDYKTKYDPTLCDEIVPARVSESLKDKLQALAVEAYIAFDCRCFGRIDMFADENENVFVSEINTIPGLTANSLLTKEVLAAGYSFQEFIRQLVKFALDN